VKNTIPWILPGESYNSNFMHLRILSVCVKKYQQVFWRHCWGTDAVFSSNLVHPRIYIFSFYKKHKKYFHHENHSYPISIHFKGWVLWDTTKTNFLSGCELRPDLIAMVRAWPFSGHYNENPSHHLHEFEEMCLCLSILGMTWETLKWKLFPFSLIEKVKQWYTLVVESTNRDWDELKDKFQLAFFLMSCINSLPRVILDFEQSKESISAAWARFLALIHTGPDLSLLDNILLHCSPTQPCRPFTRRVNATRWVTV
jgi:hypothetical protein